MHTVEIIAKVLQNSSIRSECFEESVFIVASRELGSKFGEYLLDVHRQLPSGLQTLHGACYTHLSEAVARYSPYCTMLRVPFREDGVVGCRSIHIYAAVYLKHARNGLVPRFLSAEGVSGVWERVH